MQQLKPGQRFKSAACEAEVMVIRAPAQPGELGCGGAPMLAADGGPRADLDPALAGGAQAGKRYVDAGEQIELLCIRGGSGTLTWAGAALHPKQAKALPSSD